MSFLAKVRSRISARRYNLINASNSEADRRVLVELGLWNYFSDEYGTTGVSSGDIAFLHNYIKVHKPRRVIEFGTGKSTWVIAKCMERYCWDAYGGDISLISMEELQFWYDQQLRFLPKKEFSHFDQFVRIVRSETELFHFGFVAGTSYKNTPIEHFDFCFVDGPNPKGTCNMDFIKLVAASELPMTALIDNRKSTQMAYAALIGKNKMTRYHSGLCLVENATRADLQSTRYKDIFPENEIILRL
jgi:hypothetical protein